MKTLNLIALQGRYHFVPDANTKQEQAPEQIRQLVEVVKLYRKQEEAYLDKIKRQEFAKDEKHHMMKTRQKLDNLLTTINL